MTRILKPLTFSTLALGVVTFAACGGGTPGHGETPAPAPGDPIDVVTATAGIVEWPSVYEAGGVVRARQVATVSARIVAPVVEVRVKAGDRVRRGQVLVVLDGRELQAQASRATAAASGSSLGLEAARAEQQAAEAALSLARVTFDRVRGLEQKKSATAQELDQAQAALDGAESRLAGARARVAEAEQGVAAARAGQDAATVGASYTTITAPFDGLVAARHADPGALATPGAPLVTIEDAAAFRLEAPIDASHAHLVAVGAEADARLDGQADEAWQAVRVAEIGNLDPMQHSFVVKFDLPEGMARRSGQFGRVRLRGPARQVLAVPATAVVRRGQLAFVFAPDREGLARLRMVSVGETRGDAVEVLAGLVAGDAVVTMPPPGLGDGRPIRSGARPAAGAAR